MKNSEYNENPYFLWETFKISKGFDFSKNFTILQENIDFIRWIISIYCYYYNSHSFFFSLFLIKQNLSIKWREGHWWNWGHHGILRNNSPIKSNWIESEGLRKDYSIDTGKFLKYEKQISGKIQMAFEKEISVFFLEI